MPKTLLLADDSVTIQKVVGITFANEDIELVTENNGDAALSRAREITPDIVLADVSMPGLNGYELCAAIRGEPLLAHIPVILLTGTFESYDEEKTRSVGANGHIAKPFEAQALVDLVHLTLRGAGTAAAAPAAPALPSAPAAESLDLAATMVVPPNEPATPAAQASEPPSMDFVDFSPPPKAAAPAAPAPGAPAAPDPATERTAFFDPGQGVGAAAEAPLITPEPEAAPRPPASPGPAAPAPAPVAPPPLPSAGDPNAATAVISPEASLDSLPPATPTDSPGGPAAAGDDVLYAETAFLDPRAAVDEPPSGSEGLPEAMPHFDSPVTPLPDLTPPPANAPAFDAPELDGFDDVARSPTITESVPEDETEPEDTTPDPGRSARALLDADAALDAVSVQPNGPGVPQPGLLQEATAGPPSLPVLDALEPLPDEQPAALEAAAPERVPVLELEAPQIEADTGSATTAPATFDADDVHATLEKVAWDAFGPVAEQIVAQAVRKVEEIAWEIVPQLAERLIKEEIEKLKRGEDD